MKKSDEYCVYHVDWKEGKLLSVDRWTDTQLSPKEEQQFFVSNFDTGDTVITTFLCAHPNNRLPPSVAAASSGSASFKWSKKFSIPDFGTDNSGVFGTLAFSGKASFVYIAWDAIYEITSTSGAHKDWKEKLTK
jgi:hypothetical protein